MDQNYILWFPTNYATPHFKQDNGELTIQSDTKEKRKHHQNIGVKTVDEINRDDIYDVS